jgi:hypothetical protein
MRIDEIFGSDQTYLVKWKWGSDVEAYASFTTEDGREGKLYFEETSVENPQVVDFEFEVGDDKGVSGGGDQYAIFNTVIQAFEQYLKTKKPEYITFSAKESNRFRIYAKLVNRLVGGHGIGSTGYQWLSKDNYPENMPPGHVDFVLARDPRRQSGFLPSVSTANMNRKKAELAAQQKQDTENI